MSERSYTPGPWFVVGRTKKTVAAGGIKINQSCGPGAASVGVQKVNDERLIANARLIAAAPEMFELLVDIDNCIGEITEEAWEKLQEIIKRVKSDQ